MGAQTQWGEGTKAVNGVGHVAKGKGAFRERAWGGKYVEPAVP